MEQPPHSLPATKLALKSSTIFLNETDEPISGVILISNENIEEFIPEQHFSPEKLKEILANFEFHDFGESFIFPGIIDLNVHLNSNYEEKWSNIEEVTRMASQGGITTILDHPLMNNYASDFDETESIANRIKSLQGRLHVDCGLLAYLGKHNYKSIKEIYEEGSVFGFKLHLSKTLQPNLPFIERKCLKSLFKKIEKTPSLHGVLLSFDCMYVSDRERFMCSPMRGSDKEKRLDLSFEIKKFDKFAGGVHEVIPSAEEMSDETYPCDLEIEQIIEEQTYGSHTPKKKEGETSPSEIDKLRIRANLVAKSQKENAIANLELVQYNMKFSINELDEDEEEEGHYEKEPKIKLNKSISTDNELYDQLEASDDDYDNSTTTSRKINEVIESSPKANMTKKQSPVKLIFFPESTEKQIFQGNPLKSKIHDVYSKLNQEGPEENLEKTQTVSFNVSGDLQDEVKEKEEEFKEEKTTENEAKILYPECKIIDTSSRSINIAPSKLYSRRMTVPNLGVSASKTFKKLVSTELDTIQVEKDEDKEKEDVNNRDYNIYLSHHSLSWESNGLKMIFKNFHNFHNVSILFSNLSSMSLFFMIKLLGERINPLDNVKLYTEACVPYLYFHNKMIKSGHTKFKNSPPIRIKEERDLMIQGFRINNLIDVVSSFHMSNPPEYKRIDRGNFRRCFNGLSNIGYNLQVLWTKMYLKEKKRLQKKKHYEETDEVLDQKKFDWIFKEIIKRLCTNPAKIMGLKEQKGKIKKGFQADLVVWNPYKIITVDQKKVALSSPKLFLFNNKKLYGEVTHTFLRGKLIYREGENLNLKSGTVLRKF